MPVSLCFACGRVFGGVEGFDRHRRGGFFQVGETGSGRFCADPASLGMVQDRKGRWCRKPPELPRGS
jgi:hypothetical protein